MQMVSTSGEAVAVVSQIAAAGRGLESKAAD